MKTVLLVIICGLLWSNVANGEGAWVLWEGTTKLGLPYEWKIVAAYPKYEQCIERHKKDFEIVKKIYEDGGFKTYFASQETMVIEKDHSKTTSGDFIITHKCLPGTIDPRK